MSVDLIPSAPFSAGREAEYIQTGECWAFSTVDELLGFLRRQAEDSCTR